MPVDSGVLKSRVSEITFTMNELRRLISKPFAQLNIDEKYSMRYNIIILVESTLSLCMHIAVEAHAKTPEFYREAIKLAAERLNASCVNDLASMVELRNILIHRYWPVNDGRVYEAVKANFRCVEELLNRVRVSFPVEN